MGTIFTLILNLDLDAMETLQIRARLVFHCIPAYCRLFELQLFEPVHSSNLLKLSVCAFYLRFLVAAFCLRLPMRRCIRVQYSQETLEFVSFVWCFMQDRWSFLEPACL